MRYHHLKWLVQSLHREIQLNNNIKNSVKLLEQYDSFDWSYFVYMIRDNHYHRAMIEQNSKFSLFLLTWYPHSHTNIHSHPHNGCSFKVLKGKLLEKKYSNNGILLSENKLLQCDTGYIDNSIGKHQIFNAHDDVSASLHVYAPGYFETSASLEPFTYDFTHVYKRLHYEKITRTKKI